MRALTQALPGIPSPRITLPWRRALRFVGPGYLVAVGYMDPGNWAVDIAAGGAAGFTLLSVVLAASLAAMYVQNLVVRLTVASGQDLASLIGARFPRWISRTIWLVSEIAIVATEVAELLGGAIALKLLFGVPLAVGATASAALTLLILMPGVVTTSIQEWIVGGLVAAVALGVGVELLLIRPAVGPILAGLVPDPVIVRDPHLLYLGLGILGATVMPHNLYLHSGLVRSRLAGAGPAERAGALTVAATDSAVALTLAFLVNAAILVAAAATLRGTAALGLEQAPALLAAAVGSSLAALLFAATLLAAGQSSTITGALAGQIVMAGFLGVALPAWLRGLLVRGAALAVALAVIGAGGDQAGDGLLIASQVLLSFALPPVLLALAALASDRAVMGRLSLGRFGRATAWSFALVLTGLNLYLLGTTISV